MEWRLLRQSLMTTDPIEQATVVRDALIAAGFEAWQGRNKFAHFVSLRRVTRDDLPAVKGIVKKASDPLWGDVRFFQSFITIRLMEGRAIELRDEYLARHAEWGNLYVAQAGGLRRVVHEDSLVIPIGPTDYEAA